MSELRPAVFLDRDGTLIVEREYLADPEGIELIPGSLEALRVLRGTGLPAVIVTNQAGIARGYYGIDDYEAVAAKLDGILEEAGVGMALTLYCPHHPDHSGPCECRKPGTGMHREAARRLGLDLARSYYVGDKLSDVLPAVELGGTPILVRTGYGREEEASAPEEVVVVDDLRAAADLIASDRAGSRRSRRPPARR